MMLDDIEEVHRRLELGVDHVTTLAISAGIWPSLIGTKPEVLTWLVFSTSIAPQPARIASAGL
jgi:hypothetical protein